MFFCFSFQSIYNEPLADGHHFATEILVNLRQVFPPDGTWDVGLYNCVNAPAGHPVCSRAQNQILAPSERPVQPEQMQEGSSILSVREHRALYIYLIVRSETRRGR